MPKHTYYAIRVQQQPDAEPFYLLRVDAEELLKWADVPRKKADYMAGYQRDLSARQEAIRDFIAQSPLNVVPGSVIVATQPETVQVVETDLEDVVTLNISANEADFNTALANIYKRFEERLGEDELAAIQEPTATPEDEADEEEGDPNEQPPSYLSVLARELREAIDSWESLPKARQEAVADFVKGVQKPGSILDGQHRVFGAKNVSRFNVALPVVLMPGLDPREQAFHFFVLNNKARPLTATQLRSVLSTSLSNQEIEELWDRFQQAKVRADQASWTYTLNTNPDSPFYGLIDFGLGAEGAFLKENVMFQLVKDFMSKANNKYQLLTTGISEWDDEEYRFDVFFQIWNAVKQSYTKIWNEQREANGGQFFMKVSLLTLQDLVLETMAKGMPRRTVDDKASPFADMDDLKAEVKAALSYLPPEFFQKEWQAKGLDTRDGRLFLKDQMEMAISNLGKHIGNQKLFRATA